MLTFNYSHKCFLNVNRLKSRSLQIKQFVLLGKLCDFILSNSSLLTQIRFVTNQYTHNILL